MSKVITVGGSGVAMDDARAERYESWRATLARSSVEQLIEAFNHEVGNEGSRVAR